MSISTGRRLAAASLAIVLLATTPLPEAEAVAVMEVVQHQLNVKDLTASMVSEKPYTVVFWKADAGEGHGSGQALLQKTKDAWRIIKISTGSLKDVALLESLGVPALKAQALVSDLNRGEAP